MKRKVINVLFYGFGVFFIIYYFVLTSAMGPINFSKYLLLGGIFLCIFGYINQALYKNKTYIKIIKIIKPLFFIGLTIFILTELAIVGFSLQKNMDKADYTIVLGAGIRGETLTVTLKQRVDTAIEYANSNDEFGYIVVTGGQGPGESITEAEAMKRYLESNGIDAKKVIKEEHATDTYENLQYSKEIIEKHSGKSIENLNIKVITSGFHLLRSKMLCEKLDFGNVTYCASPIWSIFIPTYYIREFIGFYKMLVFDVLLK